MANGYTFEADGSLRVTDVATPSGQAVMVNGVMKDSADDAVLITFDAFVDYQRGFPTSTGEAWCCIPLGTETPPLRHANGFLVDANNAIVVVEFASLVGSLEYTNGLPRDSANGALVVTV